jgi:hypothetical protein
MAEPYGHKDRYYDAEHHGPFDTIELDRGYCILAGGYVICPAAQGKKWCTKFEVELRCIKHSVLGTHAARTPIQVPVRLEACKESGTIVRLQLESALNGKGEGDDGSDGREEGSDDGGEGAAG